MDLKFLLDFDENENYVVINEEVLTTGALEVSIKKEELENGNQIAVIEGTLATPYYCDELQILETKRYYIYNIDVYEEDYGSKTDNIVYKFRASFFKVKYQTGEYKNITEANNQIGK